jgi:hypothetical protein
MSWHGLYPVGPEVQRCLFPQPAKNHRRAAAARLLDKKGAFPQARAPLRELGRYAAKVKLSHAIRSAGVRRSRTTRSATATYRGTPGQRLSSAIQRDSRWQRRIAIPIPVGDVRIVKWGHVEIETVKPEAFAIPARETELVPTAEASCKASMLPGMLETKTCFVPSCVVSNPSTAVKDMGRFWMFRLIGKAARFRLTAVLRRVRVGSGRTSRPARRNVSSTYAVLTANTALAAFVTSFLRQRGQTRPQQL